MASGSLPPTSAAIAAASSRVGAAPAQARQAAVDAAAVAGRKEGGAQEAGGAHGRSCPLIRIDALAHLNKGCDAEPSVDDAVTQAVEAVCLPQLPQGGAGLHGAIAAAAQLWGRARRRRRRVQRQQSGTQLPLAGFRRVLRRC